MDKPSTALDRAETAKTKTTKKAKAKKLTSAEVVAAIQDSLDTRHQELMAFFNTCKSTK